MLTPSMLLLISAVVSCALGFTVLLRNPGKRTHRLFAVLSMNLALWALGVLAIIHSAQPSTARFWMQASFIIAAFVPATFYHFTVYFPHQRFKGIYGVLLLLYAGAFVQVIGSFTPYYIQSITMVKGGPPEVTYGPVFQLMSFWVSLSMLFMFGNLTMKLRRTVGVERRQIQHVLISILLFGFLATVTNLLAPSLQIKNMEILGPVFPVLMMAMFAYTMIRYHLLDILVLASRTTMYAITMAFVVAVFFGSISSVQWLFNTSRATSSILSTLLPAFIIAVVLQPMKERLQLFFERTILKRHYDVNRLCARITRHAAQFIRLEQLLDTVARDISATIGVTAVRVWLVDEKDPTALLCSYSIVSIRSTS